MDDKKSWTEEEKKRLMELRLDPVQNKPEKLNLLVAHFLSGGSKFAVTEGRGPVRVIKGLATKVQVLCERESLNWIVDASAPPKSVPPEGEDYRRMPPADGVEGDEIQVTGQESSPDFSLGSELHQPTDYQIAHLFGVGRLKTIRIHLEKEKGEEEPRLLEFIHAMLAILNQHSLKVPDPWLAASAGLTIVGTKIGTPALIEIAQVILETRPYNGRQRRWNFHERIKTPLRESWNQMSHWAAPTGYQFMPKNMGPAIRVDTWEELRTHQLAPQEITRSDKAVEDSLMKGQLNQVTAGWIKVPLNKTSTGLVWDMLTRLPDIDRRRGKVFPRITAMSLFVNWCLCGVGPETEEIFTKPI